jgi:hypothetical protein
MARRGSTDSGQAQSGGRVSTRREREIIAERRRRTRRRVARRGY